MFCRFGGDCVNNLLKFSFVGLANVVVCALSFLLLIFTPWLWNITPILIFFYGAIFVAEGYLLCRMTNSGGYNRYLWATMATYVILSTGVIVGVYFLSTLDTNASNDFGWAILFVIIAGLLITTLAFTVITCLTVWIIQIVKRKNLKCANIP